MKRLLIAGGLVLVVVIAAGLIAWGGENRGESEYLGETKCLQTARVILMAQSVPRAQRVPCITDLLDGWEDVFEHFDDDGSRLLLTTTEVEGAEWTIEFHDSCTPAANAVRTDPGDGRDEVWELTESTGTDASGTHNTDWMRFEGGCVISTAEVPGRFDANRIFDDIDKALVLIDRASVAERVHQDSDGRLDLDPA